MMRSTPTRDLNNPKLQTIPRNACVHRRMVDEVVDTRGTKTGQLLCLECLTVFDDPLWFDHEDEKQTMS